MAKSLANLASWGAMIFLFGIPIAFWTRLPAQAPTHFGAGGFPDAYGPKGELWILPMTGLGLAALLSLLSRSGPQWNVPWTVTEEQRRRAAPMAQTLLAVLRAEVLFTFAYIEGTAVEVAVGRELGLGHLFLPVTLLVLLGTIGIFLARLWRMPS